MSADTEKNRLYMSNIFGCVREFSEQRNKIIEVTQVKFRPSR